jgi:hypothetical protein
VPGDFKIPDQDRTQEGLRGMFFLSEPDQVIIHPLVFMMEHNLASDARQSIEIRDYPKRWRNRYETFF